MKQRNQARHCIKWNKGIGLFLRKWLWFFVATGIIVAIGIIEFSTAEKEQVQVSKTFSSSYVITPQPPISLSPSHVPTPEPTIEPTYQIPSELLEEIAVETEEVVPVSETSWNEEAVYMARVIYGEARGIYSQTEQACVAWTILNRVDAGYGDSISEVCTAPNQFCYSESFPTVDDYGRDLVELSLDVIERWLAEKRFGTEESGRVLPKDYYYFGADDGHNWFRKTYEYSSAWKYTLPSPYET